MNRKIIAAILSAAVVISGVFAFKAYATENDQPGTGSGVTERYDDRGFFGCFGRGFRGFGMMGGFFNDLTDDQIDKLQPIKDKAQDLMAKFRDEMAPVRDEYRKAIEAYDKQGILNADSKMEEIRNSHKTEIEGLVKEASQITGRDFSDLNFLTKERRNSEFITELKKATTQDEIKACIDKYAGNFGQGRGNRGNRYDRSGFGCFGRGFRR